jgi:hypothetical protein
MTDEAGTTKVKLSTAQIVTIIALVGVIAGLLAGYTGVRLFKEAPGDKLGPIIFEDYDPDERPPIIVNNGSVILQPAYHSTKGRGNWAMGSSNKKFAHKHGNKPIVTLQFHAIQIDAATQMGCEYKGSGSYNSPLTDKSLTITYVDGVDQRDIRFKIAGDDLDLDFDEIPTYASGAETLTLSGDKTKPWVVKIGHYKCTYAPASAFTLKINQLK